MHKNIQLVNQRLYDILVFKNFSITDISNKSKVSKSQIYKIISGNHNTTLKTLYKILSALNITLSDFFNFSLPIDNIKEHEIIYTFNEVLDLLSNSLKVEQYKLYQLKGLTQSEIANNLGYSSYKYVNYILNGRRNALINLKLSTLFAISDELNLTQELFKYLKF